jgi:hypothetical protein
MMPRGRDIRFSVRSQFQPFIFHFSESSAENAAAGLTHPIAIPGRGLNELSGAAAKPII